MRILRRKIKYAILLPLLLWNMMPAGIPADRESPLDTIDLAFNRLYNFDFSGSHAVVDTHIRSNPDDPLGYSLRGATYLFSEFQRLKILETDFFSNDESITDKKRLKPDQAAQSDIFGATAEARRLSAIRLARNPEDRLALFALYMAAGLETEYTLMIEKKRLRSYSLSKETLGYAQKLLALNPPFYDANVTLGFAEYAVANLNFFFRLFVRLDDIKGDREKAIEYLQNASRHSRFYQPYSKILLTVVYLREKRVSDALQIMEELKHDFPENPIFMKETALLSEKAAAMQDKER